MDVFVARQPIFKRNMQLYGYELLYRKNAYNNFFEGEDDTLSTAELITNSFLVIGFNELIDNTIGFINFPAELLMRGVPQILPKDKVVIELLERARITDALIETLKKLKNLGYMIALDDFALDLNEQNAVKLLDLASIVKIEFPKVPIELQRTLLRRYKNKIVFLAEHIETHEELQLAIKMGYSLFQGYFFSKPVVMNARDIAAFKSNTGMVIHELNRPEPSMRKIAQIFENDLGLSYKLLKLANSAYYSTGKQIKSIRQAIMLIGTDELSSWLYIIFLQSMQTTENKELIKTSVIRAKMLSLLAKDMCNESDCFFAGIFSSLDVILNQDMEQAIDGLPLSQTVKDTLLHKETHITLYLDIVISLEHGDWDTCEQLLQRADISMEICMEKYLQALKWQQALPF